MDKPDALSRSWGKNETSQTSKQRKSGFNAGGTLTEVLKRDFLASTLMTHNEPYQSEQEHTSASKTPSPPLVTAPLRLLWKHRGFVRRGAFHTSNTLHIRCPCPDHAPNLLPGMGHRHALLSMP